MSAPIKMGDKVQLWGEERTVLEILPYRGRYPEHFNQTLKVTSPHTQSGTIELAHEDVTLRRKIK